VPPALACSTSFLHVLRVKPLAIVPLVQYSVVVLCILGVSAETLAEVTRRDVPAPVVRIPLLSLQMRDA